MLTACEGSDTRAERTLVLVSLDASFSKFTQILSVSTFYPQASEKKLYFDEQQDDSALADLCKKERLVEERTMRRERGRDRFIWKSMLARPTPNEGNPTRSGAAPLRGMR